MDTVTAMQEHKTPGRPTDSLLGRLARFETVVVAAPPPTAHLLTDKEIDDTPVLAALALRLPPGMRLVAARWSDGVTLLTAAASAAPDPPLSWLMEKRVRLSRRA